MKVNKHERLNIRASADWKAKVAKAADCADTTVSQFIRDSVNARIQRDSQAQSQAA